MKPQPPDGHVNELYEDSEGVSPDRRTGRKNHGSLGEYSRIGGRVKGLACSALIALALAGGCGGVKVEKSLNPGKSIIVRGKPRWRMGSYASPTFGTNFLNPEDLGSHGYGFSPSEKNGILYARRAGHIDLAHLRKSADWTAFLAAKTLENLKENKTEFAFKLYEPSCYFVQLTYPENWGELSHEEKGYIVYDAAIRLGQHFAYTATTWHEILTWFGYRCSGIIPEFPSAFSWEDIFSNLLGVHLGGRALRDTEHAFDEAMTLSIDKELKQLGVQPRGKAISATEGGRGKWFLGDFFWFAEIKKRNLDIGLDDGFVTPCLLPYVQGCEGSPQEYPVPDLDFLSEYGFSMKLEIEPRESEGDKILNVVYPDGQMGKRIEPAVHFAPIMDYIRKEAAGRGYDID